MEGKNAIKKASKSSIFSLHQKGDYHLNQSYITSQEEGDTIFKKFEIINIEVILAGSSGRIDNLP